MRPPFALAVHGGAGTIIRGSLSAEAETEYHAALAVALRAGYAVLAAGGRSVDAAVAAVVELEDCPLFNAGRGSVLTHAGSVEMEAATMDGSNLNAGAAVLLTNVKNPVRLACEVMENSPHVILSGPGAELFAQKRGLSFEPDNYFITERRLAQWRSQLAKAPDETSLSESGDVPSSSSEGLGTVGAVALDRQGNVAAATSTGGMTNKWPGRIGDTPVIGAGTYADNRSCAVSTTGRGEMFLRVAAAKQVCARVEYGGATLQEATDAVLDELKAIGGNGGLIAISRSGKIVFGLNAPGMYRGSIDVDGNLQTAIFQV